jgi:hypothetical protein
MSQSIGNDQQASTPITVVPGQADTRQNTTPAVVDPESRSAQAGVVDATLVPKFQAPETPPSQPSRQQPESQPQQQDSDQPEGDTVEMARFKAVQQIARQNEADARAYREFLKGLGVKPDEKAEFDPKAEIEKLRRDVETERNERAREQISHTTNVPVDQIHGGTPEEMRESAQKALTWLNSKLQQANVPAAVPASVVNSPAGPNDGGPAQITSRDELAKLNNVERMAAFREGRLDTLLGKR